MRTSDNVGGDKVIGDKVGGDKVVGTQIKDVAGNVIIHQHLSDKDAARNERIRQHLLEQLQATWLSGVLENNIHEVARLELGLERVDEAVERPWVMSLERPNQPPQTLPPTSKILDTFRALSGAMLILGEPGSGKTITLLELARELRKVALEDQQQPAPLVFNLSSWAQERPPLIDWLVGELFLVYGVGRKQAPEWLKTMPYHLLLDGLDEVSAEHRDACVTAINDFRAEYGPVNVVVCSRTAEYEQLTSRLRLMGAAVIQPLNETQINTYLTAANPHLTQLVANDPALHELAQTPLTLNIIALAYRDHSPDQTFTGSPTQRRHHLFTAYVDRIFGRRIPSKAFKKNQSIHYLTFLSTQMQQHDQSIYYIEKMQPAWLGKQKRPFRIISRLIVGLIGAQIFSIIGNILFGVIGWWTFGLVFGLLVGLIGGRQRIILAEALNWSWRKGLIVGLLIGMIVGLIAWWRYSLRLGQFETMLVGLSLGMIGGLISGLIGGLSKKELQTKSSPNQGIKLSGRYALRFGLLGGLLGGLSGGLVFGLLVGLNGGGLSGGLEGGLIFGVVAARSGGPIGVLSGWMIFGGDAYIKHYLLRWFLARNNYLPFKLVPFLDEMADRIILRKVGGGYIFIHRMLLEYFAGLEGEDRRAMQSARLEKEAR